MTSCVDWSRVADRWDDHRDAVEAMKAELTVRMLAELALQPGERVLELGSGTGELAARLAAAVAPGGTVVASDAAEGMVRLLKGRLDGLPGVEVAELDAADIALPAGGVDAVVFRMGLMLIAEPARAVAEVARVLRPGGRVAIAVWAGPQDNPWLTTMGMAAMMHGLVAGGPPVGPGMPFSLADPSALAALFADGFDDVRVESVDGTAAFRDADEYFTRSGALAPPLAAALGKASPEDRARVRETVGTALERFRTDDGLRLPSRALLLTARRVSTHPV